MGYLPDIYSNFKAVPLYVGGNITADTYSLYIDTQGLDAVAFIVATNANTADGSNYFTPTIKGADSEPTTASGYAACAAAELNGAFTAQETTSTQDVQIVSLKQHKYRYYTVLLDETSTADTEVCVIALVSSLHQPSSSLSPTTGQPA